MQTYQKYKPNVPVELLDYTLIKADPRQNGSLLDWDAIQKDTPSFLNLYRNGYKWIVYMENKERELEAIKLAILGKEESSVSHSKKSSYPLTVDLPRKFSRKSSRKSSSTSNRFTRRSRGSDSYFRKSLNNRTRKQLIKIAEISNSSIRGTKKEIINNLLENSPNELYTIIERPSSSSHNQSRRQSRPNTRQTRKNSS